MLSDRGDSITGDFSGVFDGCCPLVTGRSGSSSGSRADPGRRPDPQAAAVQNPVGSVEEACLDPGVLAGFGRSRFRCLVRGRPVPFTFRQFARDLESVAHEPPTYVGEPRREVLRSIQGGAVYSRVGGPVLTSWFQCLSSDEYLLPVQRQARPDLSGHLDVLRAQAAGWALLRLGQRFSGRVRAHRACCPR